MTGVVKIRGVPAVVEETFKHGVYVRGAGRPTVHAFVEDVIGVPELPLARWRHRRGTARGARPDARGGAQKGAEGVAWLMTSIASEQMWQSTSPVDAAPSRAHPRPVPTPLIPVLYACPYCKAENRTDAETVLGVSISREPLHCGTCGGPVGFSVAITRHAHTPILDLIGEPGPVRVGATSWTPPIYEVPD